LDKREQGWRLACQCSVNSDLVWNCSTLDATVLLPRSANWLVRRCAAPAAAARAPLRYQAGQHQVLWCGDVARPYSLASLPGEEAFLEFHLDCRRSGAFCDRARQLQVGDELRLGELRGGALHYDPDWQERPLWLLAAGTGLAPLWGILREALRQGHQGRFGCCTWHTAEALPGAGVTGAGWGDVELVLAAQLDEALAGLKLMSRRTMALVCGAPASVERFARRLFIAGVPRNQVLADVFTEHA
jgi:NAD(P)H-flavin reductase